MSVRPALLTLASLALGCSGPAAQTIEQAQPAEAATTEPAVQTGVYPEIDVPFTTFQLENGLTVVVHEDHKAPVVGVNVWYHVGSKNEHPGKTGFAHLFEHLMFQGSENFKGEFFEPLEKAGATDLNGTTNEDRTNYFETVPTPALDMALWMESDRMGHFAGAISQDLLDEQRGVVQNEKRQGMNRPYGKSWELMPENTFPPGHPYSWSVIGSMEDLDAASLDDVKNWFAEHYGASNAVLVLAGDITVDQAKAKTEKFFGDIPAGPTNPRRGPWTVKMTARKELTTYDQVPQERVNYVYNLPGYGDATTEYLRVASWVLGDGKNSRLYKRLVYDDQLATSARARVSDGEIASQLVITADARPGVPLAKVEAAIEEELARFDAEGPTSDELERVKMSHFADLVSRLERVGGFGGKSDLLARNAVFLGDPGAYRHVFDTIRSAKPSDVQAASSEWLNGNVFVMRVLPEPAHSTVASTADRSKVPAPGAAPNLELPPVQRAKLSNGIEIVLSERHDTPVVKVSALFDVGFTYDRDHKLGTAKLAMDALDEGTTSIGSLELAAQLERLGASVSSSAGLDNSEVQLTTLTTTLGDALDLFADVLRNPAFDDAEIERLRKRTLAAIAQEKAQPFSTALRLLGPILYGDKHPYGVPLTGSGTVESVGSITRDDLVAFHAGVVHPAHATLLVVGDTTLAAIQPELEARFGSWTGEGAPAKTPTSAAEPARGTTVYLIDKPGAEQSLILAGRVIGPRNNDTHIALDAMNAILGGTFTARINMNLREDKHWSYGARSFVLETHLDEAFGAYAQVQTDKTSESMTEMRKELIDFIGARPATADELQRTKDNKTRRLPGQNETTGRLLASIREIVAFGLPDDYWSTFVGRINGLKLADIASAAKATIDPKQTTWVVIGDLAKIEEKVRKLGFGEVKVVDANGRPATK